MRKHILILLLGTCTFITAVSQPAKSAADLYNDGIMLHDNGKYKEAIEAYKAAVVKKPDYADALYEIGWCYNELEEYANAIIYLEKAKKFEPLLTKIYFELGYAYNNDGTTKMAISSYLKTLELSPDYYEAAKDLGDIYYAESDYENAVVYFKRYLEGEETPANTIYYKMGWCLNDLEQYEEAVEYLEKYEPEGTDDQAKKWAEIGFAHYKSNAFELSLIDYNKAIEIKPGYGTAIRGMADSYYDTEDYDNALSYYKQAIQEDEENSKSCYYKIGWIYNDHENYSDAVTTLVKAIEYDEKDAASREELGYAYYMTDKYEDALNQLNKAIELDEHSKLGYYYKGLCYIALSDKKNAMLVYKQLQEINEEQATKLLARINGNN